MSMLLSLWRKPMPKLTSPLFASLLLMLAAGPAMAIDQEKFSKFLRKYAIENPFESSNAKGACVCHSTAYPNRGGFLVVDSFNYVICGVPTFTAEGFFNSYFNCTTFEVLNK
jgi:hypothetical protein